MYVNTPQAISGNQYPEFSPLHVAMADPEPYPRFSKPPRATTLSCQVLGSVLMDRGVAADRERSLASRVASWHVVAESAHPEVNCTAGMYQGAVV
jgi:hypothetical protein